MKSTTLLKKQHAEVSALFKAAEKQKSKAKATSEKIIKSLLAHMLIEEELFYPAVRELDEDLILEAYEEHATARFTMSRIEETEGSDEAFQPRLTTLRELIEHHVEEEEEDLFTKVDKKMDEDVTAELCEQMKASFEEYMELSVDELMAKIEAVSPKPSMKSRAA